MAESEKRETARTDSIDDDDTLSTATNQTREGK